MTVYEAARNPATNVESPGLLEGVAGSIGKWTWGLAQKAQADGKVPLERLRQMLAFLRQACELCRRQVSLVHLC